MKVTLAKNKLNAYLSQLYRCDVKVTSISALASKGGSVRKDVKGFGYGIPYLIQFQTPKGKMELVLSSMKRNGFGHDYIADVAQNFMLAHADYNKLPSHAKSVDVGAFDAEGNMKSLGDCVDLFLLVERIHGREYFHDLEAILKRKTLTPMAMRRCLALSDYLVKIHARKKSSPVLYRRRIRDLLGHGECIMGIIDGYPEVEDFTSNQELEMIEKKCVEWRWRIKNKTHRLSQVHGDYHPWNIFFKKGINFVLLDRSRGEWGEPADDVASLTINYIFASLRSNPGRKLDDSFQQLLNLFINNYIKQTGDDELLQVIQPFFAWRALVVASPVWYPTISLQTRRQLFNFISNVLNTSTFKLEELNDYLQGEPSH